MFLSSFQSLFYWMFYFNFCLMARIVENWVVSILILLDVLLQRGIVVTRDYRNDLFQSLFYWMFYFNLFSLSLFLQAFVCFNPYFTGCSTSTFQVTILLYQVVLVSILILLDVLLQLDKKIKKRLKTLNVSILILLDVLLQLNNLSSFLLTDDMFQSLFYWMFYFN